MSAIAHEVSRRMTPEYAKERAKEMARYRMTEARDRAVDNSWFVPAVGAALGALVGKSLLGRARDRREDRWSHRDDRWGRFEEHRGRGYGGLREHERFMTTEDRYATQDRFATTEGYGSAGYREDARAWTAADTGVGGVEAGEGGTRSLGDRASEAKERVGERAVEMKDRLGERASEMKERLGAKTDEVAQRVRDRSSQWMDRLPDRERIAASTHEDTALWAFGALALGALFGAALPVSQRERELLEPARRKVREAKELALEKGGEAMDKVSSRIDGGGHEHEERSAGYSGGQGLTSPPPYGATSGSSYGTSSGGSSYGTSSGSGTSGGSSLGTSSSTSTDDDSTPLVGPGGGPSTPIH
jgi:hypothetical protein